MNVWGGKMHFLRKFLCVLLTAVLLWAVPAAVLAVENEDYPAEEIFAQDSPEPDEPAPLIAKGGLILAPAEDVSKYPIVRFGGAMNTLYDGWDGDSNSNIVFQNNFMDFENLWPLIKEGFLAFCRLDYDGVAKIVSDALWEHYGPVRMTNEGVSHNPNITINMWDQYWHIRSDNIAYFCTDWREDPYDSAEALYKYIEEGLRQTGAEKVNLMGVSGNGNTVLAYLDVYGTDQLASVFFNISLHGGTSTYGGLATKKISLDAQAIGNISILKMDETFIDPDPVEWIVRGLFESGFLSFWSKIFKFNYDRVKDKIYEDALVPLIFTMPHVWSYVPPHQYEEAKRLIFKGDPQYDVLIKKTDRYQDEIMPRQGEILRKAASEIKVAVRAGYGLPLYGYVEGSAVHSDEKVDTQYASFGATCAPLNKPFLNSYKQKEPSEHNYISPDRMIDASTCAIPELTWFGRNQPHRGAGEYEGWYSWFLSTEGDYTVHGAPEKFGQWQDHRGDDVFIPLVAEPVSDVVGYLNLFALWIMKAWRFFLLLPLFWI